LILKNCKLKKGKITMSIILKLTLDYTFKKMFSKNIDILIDLVNSVFF